MESHFTKLLREKLEGVNLSHVARELDIPKTLLFECKQARRLPSLKNIEHVKALADYFGLSLDELLIGSKSGSVVSSVEFEDQNRKYRIHIERLK